MNQRAGIPDLLGDWDDILRFAASASSGTLQDVALPICLRAIDEDRDDILRNLAALPHFIPPAPPAMGLRIALQKGSDKAASAIFGLMSQADILQARRELNAILIDFTHDKNARAMERALRLGADVSADDYAPWNIMRNFGDTETEYVLLRWYGRLEDVNPQDPFCGTAKDITEYLADVRRKRGVEEPDIIRVAKDYRAFAAAMNAFSKDPSFTSDILTDARDAFGNNALDILAARRRLGLVFSHTLWDKRPDEMTELWERVPPVYQRMFDIDAAIAARTQRQLKKAPAPKWKI